MDIENIKQVVEYTKEMGTPLWHMTRQYMIVDQIFGLVCAMILAAIGGLLIYLIRIRDWDRGVYIPVGVLFILAIIGTLISIEILCTLDYHTLECMAKLAK